MTTKEVVPWTAFEQQHGSVLRAEPVFAGEGGDQLWADLRRRVVEHNVRVVAEYYTRITLGRLCALLKLEQQEAEDVLSALVNSKTIYAKIDRPAGQVAFLPPKKPSDLLNDWVASTK